LQIKVAGGAALAGSARIMTTLMAPVSLSGVRLPVYKLADFDDRVEHDLVIPATDAGVRARRQRETGCGNWKMACGTVEGRENHKNCPRRPWAGTQMGNPDW